MTGDKIAFLLFGFFFLLFVIGIRFGTTDDIRKAKHLTEEKKKKMILLIKILSLIGFIIFIGWIILFIWIYIL